MVFTAALRVELYGGSPDSGELEISEQTFVKLETEVGHCAVLGRDDDW